MTTEKRNPTILDDVDRFDYRDLDDAVWKAADGVGLCGADPDHCGQCHAWHYCYIGRFVYATNHDTPVPRSRRSKGCGHLRPTGLRTAVSRQGLPGCWGFFLGLLIVLSPFIRAFLIEWLS